MNLSTIIGIVLGIAVLSVAFVLTVDQGGYFLNFPGLLLVVGGTLAATLISFPLSEVARIWRVVWVVFTTERRYGRDDIDEIVQVARLWHKGDIRAVEDEMERVESPFLRTGVQLVIDGTPLDETLELLRWRISRMKARERSESQMFRTMGTFAPAFGMTGTLLGLVNMLGQLKGADFEQIGANMAVALVTTFYGILLANLVFKPIAIKLEQRTDRRVSVLSMVLEGVALISQRRSPLYIRETLYSFAEQHDDEVGRVVPKELADAGTEQPSAADGGSATATQNG